MDHGVSAHAPGLLKILSQLILSPLLHICSLNALRDKGMSLLVSGFGSIREIQTAM